MNKYVIPSHNKETNKTRLGKGFVKALQVKYNVRMNKVNGKE